MSFVHSRNILWERALHRFSPTGHTVRLFIIPPPRRPMCRWSHMDCCWQIQVPIIWKGPQTLPEPSPSVRSAKKKRNILLLFSADICTWQTPDSSTAAAAPTWIILPENPCGVWEKTTITEPATASAISSMYTKARMPFAGKSLPITAAVPFSKRA